MNNQITDWILRVFKGVLIGTGFILPGVSGGALAAIFGLYERMVSFMAHLTKDFKKNVLFFIPVGIGMLGGIVILSYPLSYCLEHFHVPTMWCFIGCIIGTFPALWKQAGKRGRKNHHYLVMAAALAAGYLFLRSGESLFSSDIPQNFFTWMIAGAVIALGVLIPGLSPSNFLLYMGMYGGMVDAFKTLQLTTLIPIAIGGLVCMLLLSKAVDKLFEIAYPVVFHIILGIVIASTMIIVPADTFAVLSNAAISAVTCFMGILLGVWMSSLEEKYKPEA